MNHETTSFLWSQYSRALDYYEELDAGRQFVAIGETRSQTCNGEVFDFANPSGDSISLETIAHVMFKIPRFNGHLDDRFPWTDGHHSLLVAELVCIEAPEFEAEALAHDSSETYTGDTPGPFKKLIREAYKSYERPIEACLAAKFGLTFPWPAIIKRMDVLAQDIEATLGMRGAVPGAGINHPRFRLAGWHVEMVERILPMNKLDFMKRFSAALRRRSALEVQALDVAVAEDGLQAVEATVPVEAAYAATFTAR